MVIMIVMLGFGMFKLLSMAGQKLLEYEEAEERRGRTNGSTMNLNAATTVTSVTAASESYDDGDETPLPSNMTMRRRSSAMFKTITICA
jgi:hypothetical protein